MPENIARLVPLALLHMVCTCNNTDGNKLVIFSSIVLYYGDTGMFIACTKYCNCLQKASHLTPLHSYDLEM